MLARLHNSRIPVKLGLLVVVAALGVVASGWARVSSIRPHELQAREVKPSS